MTHRDLNPEEAQKLLQSDEGWTYLDVRSPQEFAAGHPPGAFNVPLLFRGPEGVEPNPQFEDIAARLFSREKPLVVGCAAGGRSSKACELLHRMGFGKLVNVVGGFSGAQDSRGQIQTEGWTQKGLPVAKDPEPGRSWQEIFDTKSK